MANLSNISLDASSVGSATIVSMVECGEELYISTGSAVYLLFDDPEVSSFDVVKKKLGMKIFDVLDLNIPICNTFSGVVNEGLNFPG